MRITVQQLASSLLALTVSVFANAQQENELIMPDGFSGEPISKSGIWTVFERAADDSNSPRVYGAATVPRLKGVPDGSASLAFHCDRESSLLQFNVMIRDAKGPDAGLFVEHKVEWRVGTQEPLERNERGLTVVDEFDSATAVAQALKGEEGGDYLVIRLSEPDRSSAFERNLAGNNWPKLLMTKLDGFKEAHSFVVRRCEESRSE